MSTLAKAKSAASPAKFSELTDQLQEINSIRKAPVGSQIRRVINLLDKVYPYIIHSSLIASWFEFSVFISTIFLALNMILSMNPLVFFCIFVTNSMKSVRNLNKKIHKLCI